MSPIKGTSSEEEGLNQQEVNERKRKRMVSNRESARRSRMRKQKLVENLTAEINQLSTENDQILTALKVTMEHYMKMEAENSVLRAQMKELENRLQSLAEIIDLASSCCQGSEGCGYNDQVFGAYNHNYDDALMMMNQPIMADMMLY